ALLTLERPVVDAQRVVHAADPVQVGRQFTLAVADRDQADVVAEFAVVRVQVLVDGAVHGGYGGHAEFTVGRDVERAGEGVVVDEVDAALPVGDVGDRAADLQRVHDLGIGLAETIGD